MTEVEEGSKEGHLPDTDKLRRFSLGLGIALLIYVLACGELGDNVQTVLTPIVHFKRPSVLFVALLLASVYSAYRYWYYAINLGLTRANIREYLCQPNAVYVFLGGETTFRQLLERPAQNSLPQEYMFALLRKLPAGLSRKDCTVLANGAKEPELVNEQIAKHLNQYLPGLKSENISTQTPQGGNGWAHVSSMSFKTKVLCWIENTESWLPIIVNGLAIVAWVVSLFWPELFCIRTAPLHTFPDL
jgi:hypothetical protein